MTRWLADPRRGRWIEWLLGAAVLAGALYSLWFLWTEGFLPQPFFFDPTDTWMDWINTSLWAHDPGAYDSWGSIYPPLSFVFLRLFGSSECLAGADNVHARECDWVGFFTLHGFYVLNIVLVARTFLKIDRRTALPRSVALTMGLPMLFGLDRGNLVIVTFSCFLLANAPLVRSARLRWLAAGLAINFKIYLIGSIFPQLARRRWLQFEGALLATIAVYLVTFGLLGVGTPWEIFRNVFEFTGGYQAVNFLDLWYAGTYQPVLSLLNGSSFPILAVLGSGKVDWWSFALPILLGFVQGTIVLAVAAAWLRPEVAPVYRLTNLGTSFALISAEAGGYTQTMILLLAFMEPWRGIGRRWAIVAAYLLCIPADIVLHRLNPLERDSYLGGHPISVDYAISLGPFLRPALIMSIPFALALVTISDVGRDIRAQGWRARRRFRFDPPLSTAGGAAHAG